MNDTFMKVQNSYNPELEKRAVYLQNKINKFKRSDNLKISCNVIRDSLKL